MQGLDWQRVPIAFGYGTDQRTDDRARNPPSLSIAKDVSFAEVGGLQTRLPYDAVATAFASGSTSFSAGDVRRVERFGSELLAFTKDRLYSRRTSDSKWTERGEHLAVKVSEEPRFATTGDQFDCDRAELNGFTVYSWHEYEGSNTYGYIAAIENATGAVICAPYRYPALRIRLIPLDTVILFIYYDGISGHYCFALDPSNPSAAFAGSATTVHTGGNIFYDACRVPGADQAAIVCRKSPTTDYRVVTMTGALVRAEITKARSADDIVCAVDPTGTYIQVIRRISDDLFGDLINLSTLADVYTNQAIFTGTGNSPTGLAAGYFAGQVSGQYRCQVYWGITGGPSQTNWVDVANNLGTADDFILGLGTQTRPFQHDGRLFIWLGFAEESTFFSSTGLNFGYALQNTYFLYRDDGFLCAKATATNAGGLPVYNSLPAVQLLSDGTYAWAGLNRRVVPIGGATGRSAYAARAPRDVVIEFDSNEARRCAGLGSTLYITGGEILQYDGTQLVEVGFHVYPYNLVVGTTGASGLADGTYAVKQTARWDNARGEVDRSTSASVGTVAVTGGPKRLTVDWVPLTATHKTDRPIAIQTWRTIVNPNLDSPFYLTTSRDPANVTNPNRHLYNDPTTAAGDQLIDGFSDATLQENETCPDNGGELEPIAPPPATIIAASADRLFLAGVAGDPDRVWYSRLRNEGEVASFHDGLTVAIPRDGGAITALALLAEQVIVFRERAVYTLVGDGLDNTGGGNNYVARIIPSDVGASSAEAVATETRGIVFSSEKGKYLLDRGFGVRYIGGGVCDYDDEPVLAVHVIEKENQIRWLTSSRMLVLDYLAATQDSPEGQWCEWTVDEGLHATMWNGAHVVATDSGVFVQQTAYGSLVDYGIDVATAFLKTSELLQGAGRVRRLEILGEYRGAHWLKVDLYRDYQTTPFQTVLWQASPTTVGEPLQVKIGPSIQRCQAIKVRIRAVNFSGSPAVEVAASTEALKLTEIAFEVGAKRGLNRRLPAAQRA